MRRLCVLVLGTVLMLALLATGVAWAGAPTTTSNIDSYWHKGSFDVVLTPSGTDTSGDVTYYVVDPAPPGEVRSERGGSAPRASGLWEYGTTFTVEGNGPHPVEYWTQDAVAGEWPHNYQTVFVDSATPQTSCDVGSGWHNTNVTVSLTALDGESGVSHTDYVLGDSALPYLAPFEVSAEGATDVGFASVDLVGNREATKTVTVLIDKTPPHTTSDVTPFYVSAATINLLPSDPVSGVRGAYAWLDGDAPARQTAVSTDALGTHTVSFFSVDNAGNIEPTATAAFTVLATARTDRVVSLRADKASMCCGQCVCLTGAILNGTGTRVAPMTVRLERSSGLATWASAETTTTTAGGAFLFHADLNRSMYYRVSSLAKDGYVAATSRSVRVVRTVSLGRPAVKVISAARHIVTLSGTLRPRHSTRNRKVWVSLHWWNGRRWLAKGRRLAYNSNRRGSSSTTYYVTVALPRRGLWQARATHVADTSYAKTTSRALRFRIR
jgi:hypothetical protein